MNNGRDLLKICDNMPTRYILSPRLNTLWTPQVTLWTPQVTSDLKRFFGISPARVTDGNRYIYQKPCLVTSGNLVDTSGNPASEASFRNFDPQDRYMYRAFTRAPQVTLGRRWVMHGIENVQNGQS